MDTGIQIHRDTGAQGHRYMWIQGYRGIATQVYVDTGIQGYRDTGVQGYRDYVLPVRWLSSKENGRFTASKFFFIPWDKMHVHRRVSRHVNRQA